MADSLLDRVLDEDVEERKKKGRDILGKQREAADAATVRGAQRATEEAGEDIAEEDELYKRMGETPPERPFRPTPSGTTTPELSADEERVKNEMADRFLEEAPTTESYELVGETKPAADKDKSVRVNISDNLSKLQEAAADLPPDDKESFSADLGELRTWYQAAQDKMETRELIETMAHALTQFGAGLWGSKTGVDMSGLKFDKTNWDTKMDRLLEDFKVRLGELGERRRESQQNRQFAAQQATAKRGQDIDIAGQRDTKSLQAAILAETIRHNKETEDALRAKNGFDSKALGQMNTAVDKAMNKIQDVMVRKEVDDDRKLAHAKSIMVGELGLTPAAADDILTDKGWIDTDMDPDEALAAVGLLGAKIKQNRLEALMGGGTTAVPGGESAAPTGKTYKVQNERTGQIMEITEAQARAQKLIP